VSESTVTRAGYLVRLTLPPGMTPEAAGAELRTCIAFGRPEISLQYVEERPDGTVPSRGTAHPDHHPDCP
jgi:hypothetical protein